MPGLESDTSSYNQPLPVSPLEIAKNIGGLQQQQQSLQSGAITIDKQKLDLMSQQFGIMNNELANLIDSGATKEQAAERLTRISKTLNLPPIATNHMMEELNASPDVKTFAQFAIRRGMDTMQKYGVQLGTNENQNDGAINYQGVRQSPEKGGGFIPNTKIPVQQAPGTPTVNNDPNDPNYNQPGYLGSAGPSGVVPAVPLPRPAPGNRPLPVEAPPAVSGPSGPTVQTGHDFSQRFAGDGRGMIPSGPSPLFEEGKKLYTDAQRNAGGRAFAIKPAIQALKLMPGLSTGPGTEQFTNLVAAAKAWGIVDTKAENDPTVLRQELNKKLAQYVGGSPIAQRSDAAQTLAEAGSPNPKVQLTQALQNLTRDAIALDRVQILLPNAFKGQDFQNFIKHAGNFPQSIDEKALTLDLMDDKERDKLVGKMKSDYKNGDGSVKRKAVKFFETLQQAKDAKLYDTGD